jgi:ribosome-associated translation inhibitor RaiA
MQYNTDMDIRIKTTDYQMVPETSTYLDERIAVIERHLGADAVNARVEVEVGRAAGNAKHGAYLWFAEFNIIVPGAPSMYAKNNEDTVNAAIEQAKEEVLIQMRREKEVHRTDVRKTGAAVKNLLKFGSEE